MFAGTVADATKRTFARGKNTLNWLLWLIVGGLAVMMIVRTSTIAYSPDSWSYVDIARSWIEPRGGIGSIQGTRDYANVPWIDDTYPMLWPLTLAPGILIAGPVEPVGGYIFVLIWLLLCVVAALTIRQLRLPSAIAPLFALAVLVLPGFASEGHAGRSIPLSLLLMGAALLALLKLQEGRGARYAALTGVLLGLCAANRFDALLYGPVFISLAGFFGLLVRREMVLALLGWVLFPLLWVTYSILRLGRIYASDSGRVLTSPIRTFSDDWPRSSLENSLSVLAVLRRIASNLDVFAGTLMVIALAMAVCFTAVLMGMVAAKTRLGVSVLEAFRKPAGGRRPPPQGMVKFLVALALVLSSIQLALIAGSGYGDRRYWGVISLIFLELLLAVVASYSGMPSLEQEKSSARLVVTSSLLLLSILAGCGVAVVIHEYRRVGDQSAEDAALIDCVRDSGGVPVIPTLAAFRIPATTELRAATIPSNWQILTSQDWKELSDQYGLSVWLVVAGDGAMPIPEAATGVLREVRCMTPK
jgi:hypothetical protein